MISAVPCLLLQAGDLFRLASARQSMSYPWIREAAASPHQLPAPPLQQQEQ